MFLSVFFCEAMLKFWKEHLRRWPGDECNKQTGISKAVGIKESDKNQGIQKSSVSFRNLWSVSPVSCIFKT